MIIISTIYESPLLVEDVDLEEYNTLLIIKAIIPSTTKNPVIM